MLYPNIPLTGLEIWVNGNRLQGWLQSLTLPPKAGEWAGASPLTGLDSAPTRQPPLLGAGPQQESPGRYDSSTLVGGRRRRSPPPLSITRYTRISSRFS